jgi:lactoylglutathione lyase
MAIFDAGIGVIKPFCEDLAAVKDFYQEVLGLSLIMEDETSVMFEMCETAIIFTTQQTSAELVAPRRIASPDAGSRKCVTIAVPDVDAVCAEPTGKGVQVLGGPANRSWARTLPGSPIRVATCTKWFQRSRRTSATWALPSPGF